MKTGYIFIGGMPRTGTTLLRNVLNSSEYVGMGGESHFFGETRLRLRRPDDVRQRLIALGGLSSDANVNRFASDIYDAPPSHFWARVAATVERETFRRGMLDSDRSERALLDLALAAHAAGKPIRGEKTPGNIHHVDTLLSWFPDAKVIHMFRDPRAIHVSLSRKPSRQGAHESGRQQRSWLHEVYSSVRTIVEWHVVSRLHRRYQRRYPSRYHFCRYEDLVTNPRPILEGICAFLGIELTDAMLKPTTVNSSFGDPSPAGFNAQAVDRWRGHLSPMLNRWFVLWCRKRLVQFGYRV